MPDPSREGPSIPADWMPPMPFPPIVVHYHAPGRAPDLLWVTVRGVSVQTGQPVYQAAGPAGEPVNHHLIKQVVPRGIPAGALVAICTKLNQAGQVVYAALPHTMN